MKKIKEKKLKIIQEQQKDLNTLFNNVGYLETQKHNLLHQISTLSQEVDKYKIDLEKEYGSVNINVETGEYTEIEKQESNLKVVENA